MDDWAAALALIAWLNEGHGLSPVAHPTVIDPMHGMPVYAELPATLEGMSGVPLAFASSDPRTHALAQQWRVLGHGIAALFPNRVLMSGTSVMSLGWVGLHRLSAQHDAVQFGYDSGEYRLRVSAPQWLLVMINAVAFNRVIDIHPPPWVERRLRRG